VRARRNIFPTLCGGAGRIQRRCVRLVSGATRLRPQAAYQQPAKHSLSGRKTKRRGRKRGVRTEREDEREHNAHERELDRARLQMLAIARIKDVSTSTWDSRHFIRSLSANKCFPSVHGARARARNRSPVAKSRRSRARRILPVKDAPTSGRADVLSIYSTPLGTRIGLMMFFCPARDARARYLSPSIIVNGKDFSSRHSIPCYSLCCRIAVLQ